MSNKLNWENERRCGLESFSAWTKNGHLLQLWRLPKSAWEGRITLPMFAGQKTVKTKQKNLQQAQKVIEQVFTNEFQTT